MQGTVAISNELKQCIAEIQTLLLNNVFVLDIRIKHRHLYDTCRICIGEKFNLKNIC